MRDRGPGVCHTDAIARDGDFPFLFPGVLGHEGAAVVEAVGDGVSSVADGDPVLIGWPWCGGCRNCLDGQPRYCLQLGPLVGRGGREDGSTALARPRRRPGAQPLLRPVVVRPARDDDADAVGCRRRLGAARRPWARSPAASPPAPEPSSTCCTCSRLQPRRLRRRRGRPRRRDGRALTRGHRDRRGRPPPGAARPRPRTRRHRDHRRGRRTTSSPGVHEICGGPAEPRWSAPGTWGSCARPSTASACAAHAS